MSKRKSRIHNNPELLFNKDDFCNNKWRLFRHYQLMACNRFKWYNLPNGIESRHIEKFLFEWGQCFFYKDKNLGLICLPCTSSGMSNIYGDTIHVNVTSYNGRINKTLSTDEGVKILANDLMLPTKYFIEHYVQKMDDVETVIKRNLKQQMKPFVVTATEKNLLSVKNIIDDVNNGEEVVITDKNLSEEGFEGFKLLQTGVEYLIDKLEMERKAVESELLSFLGLNNVNTEKKERLLTGEINANNEYTMTNLDLEYKTRKLACELINDKFGENIYVEKVVDSFKNIEKRGNDNG